MTLPTVPLFPTTPFNVGTIGKQKQLTWYGIVEEYFHFCKYPLICSVFHASTLPESAGTVPGTVAELKRQDWRTVPKGHGMNQQSLFDDDSPQTIPRCPRCKGESFMPIVGGSGRMRCCKCGWMIAINENGPTVRRAGLDRVIRTFMSAESEWHF